MAVAVSGLLRKLSHESWKTVDEVMSKKELASEQAALAPVSFSELILGFASAALYYTGDSSLEGKKGGQVNLPLAKQNLDIVYLLRDKTKGNLSPEETKLIAEVLSDLSQKCSQLSSNKT